MTLYIDDFIQRQCNWSLGRQDKWFCQYLTFKISKGSRFLALEQPRYCAVVLLLLKLKQEERCHSLLKLFGKKKQVSYCRHGVSRIRQNIFHGKSILSSTFIWKAKTSIRIKKGRDETSNWKYLPILWHFSKCNETTFKTVTRNPTRVLMTEGMLKNLSSADHREYSRSYQWYADVIKIWLQHNPESRWRQNCRCLTYYRNQLQILFWFSHFIRFDFFKKDTWNALWRTSSSRSHFKHLNAYN